MSEPLTALLLVDLQRDYLDRPGLVPPEDVLLADVARLLAGFRAAGAPVAHVHTVIRPDGSDALQHWRTSGRLACVAGTAGAAPPPEAAPAPGEYVAVKQQYRGFADPGLDAALRARGVVRVVVAGVYAHACVRETVLDAYERGFEVVVAADAVGTDDPAHADATRRWLTGRAATYQSVDDVLGSIGAPPAPAGGGGADGGGELDSVVAEVTVAQRRWQGVPPAERADRLDRWAEVLSGARQELEQAIVDEVRKPVRQAHDEVDRAIGHVRAAAGLARSQAVPSGSERGFGVRRAPLGVVGILMPWNNPIALPAGKIAAATAYGNGVVFAPSSAATASARLLHRTWVDAGLPADLVGVVPGGVALGRAVAAHALIDGVALTGSVAAGREVAATCARRGVPLQAELGGNNAAVVLPDADLDADIPVLVRGAFSFAGQRCTAIRRLVVPRPALDRVLPLVADALAQVVVGDPADEATDMGPVISPAARDAICEAVDEAIARGGRLVGRGRLPEPVPTPGEGWLPPVAVLVDDPADPLVQQETFGPVLVVQPYDDDAQAVALANGVEHGLLMAVCGGDSADVERVVRLAQVGIVSVGAAPPAIHADAPFGGWKASGAGPPEHGEWDGWFLTRVQAVYRAT